MIFNCSENIAHLTRTLATLGLIFDMRFDPINGTSIAVFFFFYSALISKHEVCSVSSA